MEYGQNCPIIQLSGKIIQKYTGNEIEHKKHLRLYIKHIRPLLFYNSQEKTFQLITLRRKAVL